MHPDDYEIPDGDEIRAMRALAGLSQVEVANRSGLSKQTISRLENGEGVAVSTIESILDVLGDEL